MKLFIAVLTITCSISAMANEDVEVYQNSNGCTVEKEAHLNGPTFYITQTLKNANPLVESVGYSKKNGSLDATFAYCHEDVRKVTFSSPTKDTERVTIECDKHQNDHGVTRGQVQIDSTGEGVLKRISIDGQRKGIKGWKQDVKIDCSDLEKQ